MIMLRRLLDLLISTLPKRKSSPIELSSGAYYTADESVTITCPFPVHIIPWMRRADSYRLSAEIIFDSTDHNKPWEVILFLLHRSMEYTGKAFILNANPAKNVKYYGHELKKLFGDCIKINADIRTPSNYCVDLLSHMETERYPHRGWNYVVTGTHYRDIVDTIIAMRDSLGGKNFAFPTISC